MVYSRSKVLKHAPKLGSSSDMCCLGLLYRGANAAGNPKKQIKATQQDEEDDRSVFAWIAAIVKAARTKTPVRSTKLN
eukprot:jgi/Hompol1/5904/HPOL_000340-RA